MLCRLFEHDPAAGAWNMSVDEALVECAAADGIASLRFYQWTPATLSLGYFQSADERMSHAASHDCPVVRRASGGGAILHDRELTYSLAIPVRDSWAASAEQLYSATHDALAAALDSLGVAARLCPASEPKRTGEPFLCFQRRATGDLLVGNAKIAGSAQRRHRQAVLQHGSILLAASRFAPELPGLEEISGREIPVKSLLELFRGALESRLRIEWTQCALPEGFEGRVASIEREKFASHAWTFRR
jgi:lipoate-protein ligase A